jgi:transposase
MPVPYSTDLRQRVVDGYKAKEGSQRQLADRFKVSLSFVQRLIRRYRNTGKVSAKPHRGGASYLAPLRIKPYKLKRGTIKLHEFYELLLLNQDLCLNTEFLKTINFSWRNM